MAARSKPMPVPSPGRLFPRAQVALDFAKSVLKANGRVSQRSLTAMREAGFSEHEIVGIVASVSRGHHKG